MAKMLNKNYLKKVEKQDIEKILLLLEEEVVDDEPATMTVKVFLLALSKSEK
jgi:hypothetical protein